MTFRDILIRAKLGDETAKLMLLEQYKPMLIKGSILNGRFDEDLYQEQCFVLMKAINQFTTSHRLVFLLRRRSTI